MKNITLKIPVRQLISYTSELNEIKQLHGEILTSLDKAIRVGEILHKIKTELGHGNWLPWAEKHLPFTDRHATNYMRCYENRALLKSEVISDLTEGIRLLTQPKESAKKIERLHERIVSNVRAMLSGAIEFKQLLSDLDSWRECWNKAQRLAMIRAFVWTRNPWYKWRLAKTFSPQ